MDNLAVQSVTDIEDITEAAAQAEETAKQLSTEEISAVRESLQVAESSSKQSRPSSRQSRISRRLSSQN